MVWKSTLYLNLNVDICFGVIYIITMNTLNFKFSTEIDIPGETILSDKSVATAWP